MIIPERSWAQIEQWRRDGCCTQCGRVVIGDVDVLDEHTLKFFGAPNVLGDRVCFWCIESIDWEPDRPSRFQWGRA